MLADFPKGFGFDPTVMGERKQSYIAGRRRTATPLRSDARHTALPVVIVADELMSLDPQPDTPSPAPLTQSPLITTVLVGFLLAGAGYFVGFN